MERVMYMTNDKAHNDDYIIEDMYLSVSHAANGYVNLDNYVDIAEQNIHVRLHRLSCYVNYHTHDCFEINYVYNGTCINLVENNLFFMNEDDFIIMHPGAYHNLYSPKDSKIFNFLIRKDLFHNVLNKYNLDAFPMSTFIENSAKRIITNIFCFHSQKLLETFNPKYRGLP